MSVSPRRAATRERIIAAALEVFSERGVPAASVEEIAERAGFTRGAFYSNFESKAELCATILRAQAEEATLAAQHALESVRATADAELAELVQAAVQVFVSTIRGGPGMVLATAEMRLWSIREPELQAAVNQLQQSLTPIFMQVLQQGLIHHHAELTVPLPDAIMVLRSVYDNAVIDQVRSQGRIDQAETARLLSVVLKGLLTPS